MNDKCEAIAWLANIKEKYIRGGDEDFDECRRESIDMAIKALRQPQIVRCNDCKHSVVSGDEAICCVYVPSLKHRLDFYCAYGERRDES